MQKTRKDAEEIELNKLKNQVRDKINKTDNGDILRDLLQVFKRYKLFYGKE
jgi:hypothetical protein